MLTRPRQSLWVAALQLSGALVTPNAAYRRFIAQIIDGSQFLDEAQDLKGDENLKLALTLLPSAKRQMHFAQQMGEVAPESLPASSQPR